MFVKIKAKVAFEKSLSRPDIDKAYALTDPSDSWYPTLKKVHDSLDEIKRLPHEEIETTSADGLRLIAVCYPCKDARGTVLCVHGYTSHAEREWAFPGLFYLAHGFNVIIPYQRAHGKSEGKYITFGALERGDMLGWIEEAERRFPSKPIVVHGLSMGGGIALGLCDADVPSLKCIVSDAPNVSADGFFDNVSQFFKPRERAAIRAELIKLFVKKTGVDPSVTDIFTHVRASKYPIYLTAGSLENMDGLLARIAEECPMPVETVILPGCNHGNGMYKQTELYHKNLSAFLDKYVISE